MENKKIIISSLLNALGVIIYVSLVAWLFFAGERIFGKMTNFWGPFAFLLLFVLSASVVSLLIFGKPVMLYLSNLKKEAVKLLLFTTFWLFTVTVVVLIVQVVR